MSSATNEYAFALVGMRSHGRARRGARHFRHRDKLRVALTLATVGCVACLNGTSSTAATSKFQIDAYNTAVFGINNLGEIGGVYDVLPSGGVFLKYSNGTIATAIPPCTTGYNCGLCAVFCRNEF